MLSFGSGFYLPFSFQPTVKEEKKKPDPKDFVPMCSPPGLDSISFLTFGFSVFSFSVGENPKGKKEIQESREMS